MDLVSPDDRARTLSDCRHLVADGNGNDHDQSLAGDDQHETRLRDASVSRGLCRDSGWTGTPCRKRRRPVAPDETLARDAARHLWRSGSVRPGLLEPMV